MSEEEKNKKPAYINVKVTTTDENGKPLEEAQSGVPLESEGKTEREAELETQLAEIARQDFELSKQKLSERLRSAGKDQLADMAKLVESPEQLKKLEEITEEKESENYHAPSGRASLSSNNSSERPFQWKNQTFSSAKEMIDSLYNRLEQQGVSKEEKDAIDKTISELFRKMKTGSLEVKG